MGVVFLARDVTLDRPVAIKLLPPTLAKDPAIRSRFLREARTAARLSHPNVVPIHAVEETAGLVFFVMAYVPGETLGARIRAGGPLPAVEAARVLRDVAWALGYAHQQGVIHRDVKPDNILLESPSRRTLVTDFGIACRAGDGADDPLVGTVAYMSPEQARGEPLDLRSDLWSLGMVGGFALTGALPWPVDGIDALRSRLAAGERPSFGQGAPHAPRALIRAIDRCLAIRPGDRFASAEELAAVLDQLAAGSAELPVPLRLWVAGEDRVRGVLTLWSIGTALPAIALTTAALAYGAATLGPAAAMVVTGLTPWLFFGAARLSRTRKALAAGYTHADLLLAIRAEAERRREELAFEIGTPPTRLGRWIRRITWTTVTAAVAMMAFPGFGNRAYLWIWGVTALIAGGGAMVGVFIPGRVLPPKPTRTLRERFWAGPVGRLIVRLSGWRLGRRQSPELTLHRPTEIALGEAAGALFEALPATTRRELAGLPGELEILSRQAQRLRARLTDLDDLIASGAPTRLAGTADGDRATASLVSARDKVAGQLRETVALLESLRVGLLRLHAGTATPDAITTQLGQARGLQDRMSELALAEARIDRWLAGSGPITPSGAGASG